jgi:hypothetical protein
MVETAKEGKNGGRCGDERAVWVLIRRCRESILGCCYISMYGNEMEKKKKKKEKFS